jgi:YHS domain-containing protein
MKCETCEGEIPWEPYTTEKDGETYYFCSWGCQRRFELLEGISKVSMEPKA